MDRSGILASLATGARIVRPQLDVTQQAMLTRSFPVDVAAHPEGTTAPCWYLVHYPGPEEDMNA
ncbi:hypothetical protein ABIE89_004647 [Bradyrhizobium niftali]|uniref:hypothetical protein n=1 Tax=Bradyrhizobium niftali TaxID=2560055 RepID=UPI00383405CF